LFVHPQVQTLVRKNDEDDESTVEVHRPQYEGRTGKLQLPKGEDGKVKVLSGLKSDKFYTLLIDGADDGKTGSLKLKPPAAMSTLGPVESMVQVKGKYLSEVRHQQPPVLQRLKSMRAAAKDKNLQFGRAAVRRVRMAKQVVLVAKGLAADPSLLLIPGADEELAEMDQGGGKNGQTRTKQIKCTFKRKGVGIKWKLGPEPANHHVVLSVGGQAAEVGVKIDDVLVAVTTGADKDLWAEASNEEYAKSPSALATALEKLPLPITLKFTRQVVVKVKQQARDSKRSEEVRKATHLHQVWRTAV
jgi:hypothetical protein